jgi:hypothetical protein
MTDQDQTTDVSGPHTSPATPGGLPEVTDITWRFTAVLYKAREYPISRDLDAYLRLSRDGTFIEYNLVNWQDGRWTSTPDGFRITEYGGTDKGGPWLNPDDPNPSPKVVLHNALATLECADDVQVSGTASGVEMRVDNFLMSCITDTRDLAEIISFSRRR